MPEENTPHLERLHRLARDVERYGEQLAAAWDEMRSVPINAIANHLLRMGAMDPLPSPAMQEEDTAADEFPSWSIAKIDKEQQMTDQLLPDGILLDTTVDAEMAWDTISQDKRATPTPGTSRSERLI